jgi:hypothetical protein
MDTQSLRFVIKEVLNNYARLCPSHGEIRLDVVFDEAHDRYALMQTGWSRGKRVRGNLVYVTIASNQVQIEYDGMEKGITDDLLDRGVPATQVIHAFLADQREVLAIC